MIFKILSFYMIFKIVENSKHRHKNVHSGGPRLIRTLLFSHFHIQRCHPKPYTGEVLNSSSPPNGMPYRTKIRRTKFSADKTFRRTIFSAPLKSMSWKNIFIAKLLYRNTNQVDVKFVGQKFGGQNFRHLAEFSAILSAEFLSDKVCVDISVENANKSFHHKQIPERIISLNPPCTKGYLMR